jgi:hypothetical protein
LWESAGSERQAAEFMSIKVGDLVILKKNQKIGETMRLSGFGRVTGIRASTDPTAVDNVLIMDWSPQTAEMAWACNECQKCRFQTRLCPPHGLSERSNRIE